MIKKCFRFIILFFLSFLLIIPVEKSFSQTPFPGAGEVFRDDIIPRVDIIISPDTLDFLLDDENVWSNYLHHATFVFDNGDIRDTIDNIGFRLRGNTSRVSAKKSFKISFNTFESGRKFYGLEKMNLNGEHNDPSVVRSKICWDILRQMQMPASRANHVDLYINGEYFGLYINVEHVDEEFVDLRFGNNDGNLYKCLWPANLNYFGTNPDLYKLEQSGRRVYALKTNTEEDDYSDIANFIYVLNKTPIADMPCELEKVFNVNSYLKAMVFDILSGNWDGPIYNQNNFYLYHNTATEKFEYIPYDLDNTLGIDWLDKNWGTRNIYNWAKFGAPRPIYWNIFAVTEYRNRFSYFMKKALDDIFNETQMFPYIDGIKDMIDNSALLDTYRTLDYGFSFDDYNTSFEEALPFYHTPYGIKQYIEVRKDNALSQLELNDISPIILEINNNNPNQLQDVFISAFVDDDFGIESVEACYQIGGAGDFICVEMFDDGLHNDGDADDNIFAVTLPPFGESSVFNYFITANDDAGNESREPVCENKQIFIGESNLPLYINEFMASNSFFMADEEGEFDDWVEIFYAGTDSLFLGDKYLSENQNIPDLWQFPEIWIQPGEFLVIWADNDEEQGDLHTNFKLSKEGEFIGIFDNEGNDFALIDGVSFGAQETDVSFGRVPDGTGVFQLMFPTPGAMNILAFDGTIMNADVYFSVFPNPCSDYLTISIKNLEQNELEIQLTDMLGREIARIKKHSEKVEEVLNITALPKGIYFISLKSGNTIFITKKVIKR